MGEQKIVRGNDSYTDEKQTIIISAVSMTTTQPIMIKGSINN